MTDQRVIDLETLVVRGLQAGIASYRVNHEVAPDVIAKLHVGIRRLLQEHGALKLCAAGQFLLLNNERLPRGDDDRVYARRLSRALRQREVLGLSIEPSLSADELHNALRVLGAAGMHAVRPEEISRRLEAADVQNLQVIPETARPMAGELGAGMSIHYATAQDLYLRALRTCVPRGARDSGEQVDVRRIKRVVQRMVDLMLEDDVPLLGLTSIKSLEDYEITHPVNVAILAIALGCAAGLSKMELQMLGLAGLFHDIGQNDVPREIMMRKGPLTREEWVLMQRHTISGAARLMEMGPLEFAAPLALAAVEHHMGISGRGYPRLPTGHDQSLLSRIIVIADTFDALTCRRVYRQEPVSPDRAMAFLLNESGTTFDPIFIKLFVKTMGLYPPGSTVKLDTGEIGVVSRPNRDARFLHRPTVCLLLDSRGVPQPHAQYVDLSERNAVSDAYVRTIQQTVDPEPLEITPAAVFLRESTN